MDNLSKYIEYVAQGIEIIGVLVIVIGIFIALARFLTSKKNRKESYETVRHELGKGILLGLEILVAADIIATVVTEPTMNRVLTLGLIVLIRTFLSLSLEIELERKFPWQRERKEEKLK